MSSYQWSPLSSGSSAGVPIYPTPASFPASATSGDLAVDASTGNLYEYSGSAWRQIAGPNSAMTLGNLNAQTQGAKGAALVGGVLSMQSANASFAGLIDTAAQTLAGVKTFSSILNADGGIDRSTAGTLTIGSTNASVINIGNSGATVNIQGTTIYENTPHLQVVDPLITVNSGGAAGSGQNSGIEIEENSIITGYAETSADRNSWILKAPNTAGIATITPGGSGITLDQSSHNPVTIGTANGLSLATQALSLALSSTSTTGALSSTDWNTFNGKQAAGTYVTSLTVVSTNGFTGSFTAGATPALTLTTSITGVLKGSGGALALATAGTDYSLGTSALATGILKSTTSTGALTIAAAGDFPTLNQNTTGTAANVTASSNSTLTTLSALTTASSLASIGTVTTGTWSATTIALNKGGTGQTTKAAAFDALSPMTTAGDLIYGGASGTGTRLAAGTSGQYLKSVGAAAPVWTTLTQPTVQKFTTGSGTYTTPAGVTFIRVRMVGGGGGGGGSSLSANNNGGTGGTGGNTTFGTTLLVANGGVGGGGGAGVDGAAGGTASLGTGPIGLAVTGSSGGGGAVAVASQSISGGMGGVSPFGGSGGGSITSTPLNPVTNTGTGGSGAGVTNARVAGAGGGAGGYVDAIITAPLATYAYAVGAAGTFGALGTSGSNGAAGASGIIIVEEYYQ